MPWHMITKGRQPSQAARYVSTKILVETDPNPEDSPQFIYLESRSFGGKHPMLRDAPQGW